MVRKIRMDDASDDEAFVKIAIWDVDEDLKPYGRDHLLRSQAEGQYTAIIKFINDHGMFRHQRTAVDGNGRLLIRQVFEDDLTDEGKEFVRMTIKPWFRSKASARNPNNIAILEKYLKKLRE